MFPEQRQVFIWLLLWFLWSKTGLIYTLCPVVFQLVIRDSAVLFHTALKAEHVLRCAFIRLSSVHFSSFLSCCFFLFWALFHLQSIFWTHISSLSWPAPVRRLRTSRQNTQNIKSLKASLPKKNGGKRHIMAQTRAVFASHMFLPTRVEHFRGRAEHCSITPDSRPQIKRDSD